MKRRWLWREREGEEIGDVCGEGGRKEEVEEGVDVGRERTERVRRRAVEGEKEAGSSRGEGRAAAGEGAGGKHSSA